MLAGVAEGVPVARAQRRRALVPGSPAVLEAHRPPAGQMAVNRRLRIDGDVLVERRASLQRLEPGELALGVRAHYGRLLGAPRIRLGRDREPVLEDPPLVEAAPTHQHRLGSLQHRGWPAHIDVGFSKRRRRAEELLDGLVHEAAAGAIGQHGHKREIRESRSELRDQIDIEEVALSPCAVKEPHGPLAPLRTQLPQHGKHWRHPRASRDHQDRALRAAQVKDAIRACEAHPGTGPDLAVEHPGQAASGVALDDQL